MRPGACLHMPAYGLTRVPLRAPQNKRYTLLAASAFLTGQMLSSLVALAHFISPRCAPRGARRSAPATAPRRASSLPTLLHT